MGTGRRARPSRAKHGEVLFCKDYTLTERCFGESASELRSAGGVGDPPLHGLYQPYFPMGNFTRVFFAKAFASS